MFNIPKTSDHGSYVSDPTAASMISILGGVLSESVVISGDQRRSLMGIYGFHEETEGPALELMKAAVNRDMFREAKRDGLRVMAVMARFIPKGQDPVKFVVQMMAEVGCDIGGLCEWADEESELI